MRRADRLFEIIQRLRRRRVVTARSLADQFGERHAVESFAEIEGRPISTGSGFTAGNTMSIHLLHSRAVWPTSPIWKPCGILGEWLESLREVLATWASRSRERNLLAQMSDADLKDIGASRYDAMMEIQKPFWRP